MKWDVFYKLKIDKKYHEMKKKLRGEYTTLYTGSDADKEPEWLNGIVDKELRRLISRYEEWNLSVVEDEPNLVEMLFALHDNNYDVARETEYETKIMPHIEVDEDTLVLNLDTHEIRAPRSAGMEEITVYNTDDINSSAQKWGYVRIINEVWKRDRCIPVLSSGLKDMKERHYYHIGSSLGTHPQYAEMEMEDLCEE